MDVTVDEVSISVSDHLFSSLPARLRTSCDIDSVVRRLAKPNPTLRPGRHQGPDVRLVLPIPSRSDGQPASCARLIDAQHCTPACKRPQPGQWFRVAAGALVLLMAPGPGARGRNLPSSYYNVETVRPPRAGGIPSTNPIETHFAGIPDDERAISSKSPRQSPSPRTAATIGNRRGAHRGVKAVCGGSDVLTAGPDGPQVHAGADALCSGTGDQRGSEGGVGGTRVYGVAQGHRSRRVESVANSGPVDDRRSTLPIGAMLRDPDATSSSRSPLPAGGGQAVPDVPIAARLLFDEQT